MFNNGFTTLSFRDIGLAFAAIVIIFCFIGAAVGYFMC